MDFGAEQKKAVDFLEAFYKKFDNIGDPNARNTLFQLYRDPSMLTYHGDMVAGPAAIAEKYKNLPFTEQVKHLVLERDYHIQPCTDYSILVVAIGKVQEYGQPAPQNFTEVFQLVKDGDSYWILNDIFVITGLD